MTKQIRFYIDNLETYTYFPEDEDTINFVCPRENCFTNEKHIHTNVNEEELKKDSHFFDEIKEDDS